MPIRNSKVPSSELFNRTRKKRLSNTQNKPATTTTDDSSKTVVGSEQGEQLEKPDQELGNRFEEQPNKARAEPAEPVEQKIPSHDKPSEEDQDAFVNVEQHDSIEPETPQEPPLDAPARKAGKAPSRNESENALIKLHMDMPHPAPGVSPTFDHLVEIQGEKVAFRLLLGKALELYAASLLEGTADDTKVSYTEGPQVTKTTRMFPRSAYEILTKNLNRAGLFSERAMGTLIGRRALAAFVAEDNKSV